jgi:hypothetical protein
VFGRELRLPCDLLFGIPPDKEQPTTDLAADLVDHLHDIHHYAHQHLKLASDQMKTRYNKLANSTSYNEGNRMWLYRPIRTKGKSPKLHTPLWQGPYKVVTRINDVVKVVDLDWHIIREPLGTSALKEGVVGTVREWSP